MVMQRTTPRTALVLGATGGIGGTMARGLRRRGWSVRALHRRAEAMARRDGLDWRQGDAMEPADVVRAAEGAQAIVHAVNPPGYRHWDRLVLPMLESSIAASRATGARIVLPGNVYNFGPNALPLIDEGSPQNPVTRKGRIRVEMERRLEAAGVPALIVRAGDYFGPEAASNWFAQVLVRPGRPLKAVTLPGDPGIGHQWAYLPDVAETMLRLLDLADLDRFAVYHMGGHWDPDGLAFAKAIRQAAGRPDLTLRRFPWPLLRLAAPVVPLFRELGEMRYLWRQPVRMTNDRLVRRLGAEPHTPLEGAVRATLASLGLVAPDAEAAVAAA
jgi:nucleoside-diphosphate-sugar epimerase